MAKDRTTVADLITGSLVSILSHGELVPPNTHTYWWFVLAYSDSVKRLLDLWCLEIGRRCFNFNKEKTSDFFFFALQHANSPFDETVFICFDKVAVEMYV